MWVPNSSWIILAKRFQKAVTEEQSKSMWVVVPLVTGHLAPLVQLFWSDNSILSYSPSDIFTEEAVIIYCTPVSCTHLPVAFPTDNYMLV